MSDTAFPYKNYLSPKYWPMWLGFGILRGFTLLPVRWSLALGSSLGYLIYLLAGSRRRVAYINLKQAYPDYSEEQLKELNLACFRSLGMSIFETGYAWYSRSDYLKKICCIEGQQYLDDAMKQGKGVILLTGHFTALDIGARMIGFYSAPYNGVYKKAHNPLFNAMMVHCRARYGEKLIENKDVRSVIRGLKSGHSTWFAPDQDFANQDIVFTPYLGGIASTLTATTKMVKMTGAQVVPFYPLRLDKTTSSKKPEEKNKVYKIVVLPPLENFPSDDIEADSARINKSIEEMVYAAPTQYGWMHKRFKTTADRLNNFYSKFH